jgi:HTH-type transcriptional regulator / antitoxin HigA
MDSEPFLQMSEGKPKPPGEFIRAELEARGWAQADLARIVNRPVQAINEMIQGKKAVTPETAVALGFAFGTGPEIWMTRESAYRLSLVERHDPEIQRRAKLFDFAPVKDMEKRGWIQVTNNPGALERELCRFFGVASLDEEPKFHAAARQTAKWSDLTGAQKAWCIRGAKLASVLKADPYKPSNFEDGMTRVRQLADFPEKVRHVPRVLAEIGIRVAVIEPLPHTRIDGAAFWLSDDAPVIVLSMRYDRIDGFWFTLAHELSHIRHRDTQSVDSDLIGEAKQAATSEMESRADMEAAEMLIPSDRLKSFIGRVKPFYSKVRINQFAQRIRVHPGIITGQLQHLREISFATNREMLAKVRDLLIAVAITDGWGKTAPII